MSLILSVLALLSNHRSGGWEEFLPPGPRSARIPGKSRPVSPAGGAKIFLPAVHVCGKTVQGRLLPNFTPRGSPAISRLGAEDKVAADGGAAGGRGLLGGFQPSAISHQPSAISFQLPAKGWHGHLARAAASTGETPVPPKPRADADSWALSAISFHRPPPSGRRPAGPIRGRQRPCTCGSPGYWRRRPRRPVEAAPPGPSTTARVA